ncbi:FtsQ-type POTRA domain-containing protein [Desulfobacterales bacterium HSG2]|nr:FtsQ-type POTRA domain-containing protein [Desulfobacterales bacterium HSG2]
MVVTSSGSFAHRGYAKHISLLVREDIPKNINTIEYAKFFLKIMGIAALLTMTSLLLIFLHDCFTQCDYFGAKYIAIKGICKLSEQEVMKRAQIRLGVNILSVNLSKAEKKLESHPWIAEADIRRGLPSNILVKITEQKPLAVLRIFVSSPTERKYRGANAGYWEQIRTITKAGYWEDGERDCLEFMINTEGKIFKKWDPFRDPRNLPVITGLSFSDIRISEEERFESVPYKAVMRLLQLGKQPGSVLPNRSITKIKVDREMGVTLQLAERPGIAGLSINRIKAVKLGYNNYPDKYGRLREILFYLGKQNIVNIDSIDLNNLNRIVVSEGTGYKSW